MRIYQYYLPVFFWCESQLTEFQNAAKNDAAKTAALVIGIQAPQGCGKTTLVEELQKLFEYTGRRAATVSVDDFYLSYPSQVALATVGIPQ